MSCANCGTVKGIGHFGVYTQAGAKQLFSNTGLVKAAPNITAGMHIATPGIHGLGGVGDIFGANQTNWISGVPNEYIAGAAVLLVLVAAMR